jgi:hypothetical protein
MYKKRDRQLSFIDFNQPFGLELDPENRWIKKSALIPWDEIEKEYANLFKGYKGNVAKPARLALGALMIQKEYGISDEETAAMIQENPYFQYFCGLKGFTLEAPFDSSLMVHFRKRFTPERLSRINEKIIAAKKEGEKRKPETSPQKIDPGDPGELSGGGVNAKTQGGTASKDNSGAMLVKGTLIVDATCAPSYIKYPTDTDLLNKAREKTEEISKELSKSAGKQSPRMYSRKAKKEYAKFSRKRKKTKKEIRRAIFKQLRYLRRDLEGISGLVAKEKIVLSKKISAELEVIRRVYKQQYQMYKSKTHTVEERIVSLSQPWVRPIVRGKSKTPVEFGAKLDISVSEGFVRLEHASFDAYNESGLLGMEIEKYKERTGFYPARVLADKIYRNRENLKYCRERGIRLSGPALGRRPNNYVRDLKQENEDAKERIEVERAFSLAKRKYGLGILYTRLPETTLSSIALSIILLNLNKVLLCSQIFAQLFVVFTLQKFIEEHLRRFIK